MRLVPSPRFNKSLRRLDAQTQDRVREKLKLFLENKYHPSLRYKPVQALKRETPPDTLILRKNRGGPNRLLYFDN